MGLEGKKIVAHHVQAQSPTRDVAAAAVSNILGSLPVNIFFFYGEPNS
jgi:hypothetical protein